jgi:hypothetical protein
MGKVIEVGELHACSICHKRQATILCDMPTGRIKTMHMRLPNGLTDYENSFKEYTTTCDKAVCEECATEINPGVHFCCECLLKLKG